MLRPERWGYAHCQNAISRYQSFAVFSHLHPFEQRYDLSKGSVVERPFNKEDLRYQAQPSRESIESEHPSPAFCCHVGGNGQRFKVRRKNDEACPKVGLACSFACGGKAYLLFSQLVRQEVNLFLWSPARRT